MPHLIAGVYEIREEIGSGGGGIVYLGYHTRLNKIVVLKADRRSLKTGSEKLRREVDLLKSLNNSYIPQVYDFVEENGVVYTVMDYIEGESLDKVLRRGERPSQPEVITWACQLLTALHYLHSRPPYGILHGDIKPANIMRRPNGDVCLIDYNIALALGESGAVKVGHSRGYASPEHYDADEPDTITPFKTGHSFKSSKEYSEDSKDDTQFFQEGTITLESAPTETMVQWGSSYKKKKYLDVRSDIYSLGATLYHLLSGKKPPQKAEEVVPLGKESCSPEVSAIIRKAMCPHPEDRYQSAEEMLSAFLHLYENDARSKKHKRRIMVTAAMLIVSFLCGGFMTFTGLKQAEQRQRSITLAEYSANALAAGDINQAISLAMQAVPEKKTLFQIPPTAAGRKALTDAVNVYDLSDTFQAKGTVPLSSAPFHIDISPKGTRFAVVCKGETVVFETESLKRIAVLPTQQSAMSDVCFLTETRIIYAGTEGVTVYDLHEQQNVWCGNPGTTLALSKDGKKAAAVFRNQEYAFIYDIESGSILKKIDFHGRHIPVVENDIFADPEDEIFCLNEDGSLLAVSFSDGSLQLFNTLDDEEYILLESSQAKHLEGAFFDGFFACSALIDAESQFYLIDLQSLTVIANYSSGDLIKVKACEDGILLTEGKLLVKLDPSSGKQTELAYGSEPILDASVSDDYTIISEEGGSFSFYDAAAHLVSKEQTDQNSHIVCIAGAYALTANQTEHTVRVLEQRTHKDKELTNYDSRYRHREARISSDRSTVMLFSIDGFRILGMDGAFIMEKELEEPDQIYDEQFRRDGGNSWLEVTWYDGTQKCYSAADGSMISSVKKAPPDRSLKEIFETDQYRIVSVLHEKPQVYALKSGRLVGELQEDAYLTYVTQVREGILTEYVDAQGRRYGVLLNDWLEAIAKLPNLCDVYENRFIFDETSGSIREVPMYSLEELRVIGREQIKTQ